MIEKGLEKGKSILLPFVEGSELRLSLIEDLASELEPGSFGILEPKQNSRSNFPVQKVGLIIVPGLAFDFSGHRLGYGKGYYDRLLKQASPDTDFIGLAYEFQMKEELPHEEQDVPVHKIITEKRVILAETEVV